MIFWHLVSGRVKGRTIPQLMGTNVISQVGSWAHKEQEKVITIGRIVKTFFGIYDNRKRLLRNIVEELYFFSV